jgi:hypothetical protein
MIVFETMVHPGKNHFRILHLSTSEGVFQHAVAPALALWVQTEAEGC